MKKQFSLLLVLLFTLTVYSANNNRERITRDVSNYNSIISKCSADIIYIQNNDTKIEISANSEDIDKVITKVKDGTLIISIKNSPVFNFSSYSNIIVYAYSPNLENVTLAGSGNFEAKESISGIDFNVNIQGSGNFEADMDMQNVNIKINGSGDIDISGIKSNLLIENHGSGDAIIKDAEISNGHIIMRGSGDINIEGHANILEIKQSGSGDLYANHCICKKININKSGSGDANITAKEELIIKSNGSGDTKCNGNPKKLSQQINGSGELYIN